MAFSRQGPEMLNIILKWAEHPNQQKTISPSMPVVPVWETQLGWLTLSLGAVGLKRMEVTFHPWSTGPCAGLVV